MEGNWKFQEGGGKAKDGEAGNGFKVKSLQQGVSNENFFKQHNN